MCVYVCACVSLSLSLFLALILTAPLFPSLSLFECPEKMGEYSFMSEWKTNEEK